jgi:Outer membrane protein beta-barrel domain
MIQKFAKVSGFRVVLALILATILAGATTVHGQEIPPQQPAQQPPAQQPPAQHPPVQQPPAQPQPSNQQAGPEETSPDLTPGRKPKVKDYKNWTYNVGGGASLTSGTTSKYVRSGGFVAAAGVARNYAKYFGVRFDFQFDNLPLRTSALQSGQTPGASSHVYSFNLDPVINIPVTKTWGGYILGGFTYLYRSGKLDSSTAIPGSACNGFFLWWGQCSNGSLPLDGNFLHASESQFGENFGGGVTRAIRPNMQIYAEFRFLHGKRDNITTDVHPITVGVRW